MYLLQFLDYKIIHRPSAFARFKGEEAAIEVATFFAIGERRLVEVRSETGLLVARILEDGTLLRFH